MNSEKTTCPKKILEILNGILRGGLDAPEVIVNTVKDSACSTPNVESIELRRGDDFVVISYSAYSNGINVRVPPTPVLVKKFKVSAFDNDVLVVSKVFTESYDATAFRTKLVSSFDDTRFEEIEVPE